MKLILESDIIYLTGTFDGYMILHDDIEYQRYGRNKDTGIRRSYVDSGAYRRKFDVVTSNEELARLLYRLAKRMLLHRSGTRYEDMYWVDPQTVAVVAEMTDSNEEERIVYGEKLQKMINTHPGLITMHNHPYSMPPSIDDFNSAYQNKYLYGLVICHDGTVYRYSSEQEVPIDVFDICAKSTFKKESIEKTAQIKTIERLSQDYEIYNEEVG